MSLLSPNRAITARCKTSVVDLSRGAESGSAWNVAATCRCGWVGPRRAREWAAAIDAEAHLTLGAR